LLLKFTFTKSKIGYIRFYTECKSVKICIILADLSICQSIDEEEFSVIQNTSNPSS